MVVLAFLSDPEVVGKILKHLGLPTLPPALAAARPSGRVLGFALAENGGLSPSEEEEGRGDRGAAGVQVRPPP